LRRLATVETIWMQRVGRNPGPFPFLWFCGVVSRRTDAAPGRSKKSGAFRFFRAANKRRRPAHLITGRCPFVGKAGSLSKSLWEGLGVGWIRASGVAFASLAEAKARADFGVGLPSQAIAVRLLCKFDMHAQRRKAFLASRWREAFSMIQSGTPEWSITPSGGGPFLWVNLHRGSATQFARFAERNYAVRVLPGTALSNNALYDQHLRISIARPRAQIDSGVQRLLAAWKAFHDQTSSRA
jgi:histidinol-phosphate/aromatic aminotransferase/cobyric acid decarboxylase-like protein